MYTKLAPLKMRGFKGCVKIQAVITQILLGSILKKRM